ncbi:zf-HC2 domain-containing protein, partial [Kineococcus sp. R8]
MSGPHLGARVTPLVDGRLAPDVAARALDHVTACCACAQAVEAERLVKARVAALGVPGVSADLMARLLDIGGPAGP